MTLYGPAQMFGARPYVKPRALSKSQARRILSDLDTTGQAGTGGYSIPDRQGTTVLDYLANRVE